MPVARIRKCSCEWCAQGRDAGCRRSRRRAGNPIRTRRAIVVMASAQRQPVPAITRLMQVSEAYVRQVIHDFNERGFEALDPKWSWDRPTKVDRGTREHIACVARCCPRDLVSVH
ncbi:helix-turn-helix domain-containing protein [Nocardia sp. NPDC049707]|uniref:helix-turn-helix domain-containing protein n=1 Tax=Nocardia sp. NPDC049707 TaxID=3154735 RepID=UPI0034199F6A